MAPLFHYSISLNNLFMIKKKYPLLLTLLCLCFSFSTTFAQRRLWGTLSGGVYYINLDGTGFTTSLADDSVMGNWPQGLVQTSDGSIVGVNDSGGLDSGGSLFKISPTGAAMLTSWSYPGAEYAVQMNDGNLRGIGIGATGTTGFKFDINYDGTSYSENYFTRSGFWPAGGLIKASNGLVYGLSQSDPGSRGFVYRIDATNAPTTLYFSNALGKRPNARFVEGPGGFLYATAQEGGTSSSGTIFKMNIAGTTLTKIFDFNGPNGSKPFGEMALDGAGVLYGMTASGGLYDKGVIFKINTNGSGFSVLHHFNSEYGDGYLALDGTTLYGHGLTGDGNGGFLFTIQTNGTSYTHLYNFPITPLSTFPQDRLIIVDTPAPAIHLVTPANGAIGVNASGTFSSNIISHALSYQLQLSTSSSFSSVAFTFNSINNNFAVSGLSTSTTYYARVKTNVLPGWGATTSFTTVSGGIEKMTWGIAGQGIFHVKPDGTSFTNYYHPTVDTTRGTVPRDIFQLSDGTMLTVSDGGGANELGTLNRITPSGMIKLYDWTNYPDYAFVHMAEGTDGFVYGVGISATQNSGRIFRIRPDGTGYSNHYFVHYGYWPAGNIIRASDGHFYGMSYGVGPGWIFKINDALTDVDQLYNFTTATGKKPEGGFVEHAGFLYGLLRDGGAFNKGTIFKINLGATVFTKLHDFNGTDGSSPRGDIAVGADGKLYGTTATGGSSNNGVIFKMNADGTGYTLLHQFDGVAGKYPRGKLILDGNTLYGYAESDGSTPSVLYSLHTDGTVFSIVKEFTGDYVQGNLFMTAVPFSVLTARSASIPEAEMLVEKNDANIVHPNPFEREFSVEVKSNVSTTATVTLIDIQGKIVLNFKANPNQEYHVGESLASGMYILKVMNGNDVNFYRVIKK
jgi:uncharacterized repeat protein (TIGR03803 family)